ncbi:MAG: precorrin-2 C(20)-methyltransferase [Hyphomicrobiaceae bacterium]
MSASSATPGTVYGVGVGPGAPDLLTLRAARIVETADVLAYFAKRGRRGNGRTIVEGLVRPGTEELPLLYPVTTELPVGHPDYERMILGFYEDSAAAVRRLAEAGRSVAVISEGDPFFYGSFMHLWRRLRGVVPVEVVPGVTGMSGCWTRADVPITWGDDILTVLPGTLAEEVLAARLSMTDAAVVMKLGHNLPKVRRAMIAAGLHGRAIYVERGAMAGERVMPLADKTDDDAPYFSMILVPGEGRRI